MVSVEEIIFQYSLSTVGSSNLLLRVPVAALLPVFVTARATFSSSVVKKV